MPRFCTKDVDDDVDEIDDRTSPKLAKLAIQNDNFMI